MVVRDSDAPAAVAAGRLPCAVATRAAGSHAYAPGADSKPGGAAAPGPAGGAGAERQPDRERCGSEARPGRAGGSGGRRAAAVESCLALAPTLTRIRQL